MKTQRWLPGAAVLVVLLVPAGVRADEPARPNTLTPKEVAEGWILLFDGKTTKDWTSPNGSKWTAFGGMLAPQAGKPGLLVTTKEFGPCEVRLQYLAKIGDPLKVLDSGEDRPMLRVGCGPDGTGGYSTRLYSGTSAVRLLGSGPSSDNTGWVDVTVTLTQVGNDRVARLTIRGRGVDGSGNCTTKNRVASGHIALSGNGVIFRSVKFRPLGTKTK
jgi:hypothetical protein